MQLPAIIIYPDGSRSVFYSPAGFPCETRVTVQRPVQGDDPDAPPEMVEEEEVQVIAHPPEAWTLWTADDWAAMCPGLTVRPVTDPGPPTVAGKRAVRRPVEAWEIGDEAATVTYEQVDLTPAEIEAQAAAARRVKARAIDAERDRRLGLGALHAGKRFSMADSSRTDLGGMATTAGLVLSGALPTWPESYAQGWIAIDNTRLPLPDPADGIALAAAVGIAYSAIVQHARDLKDAAQASDDPATVDELAGWPE
ncbi:hypothetical protein ABMY26_32300 [Azospirillum sp. HJ39]|uniref:DUF4376 domain-containing protein n=1 Tax=Azospirillum sp. HJ39 TaxID=3159496 RepID=UPI003557A014